MSLETLMDAYNWQAGALFFGLIVLLNKLGTYLAFKVPDLQRMREINRAEDRIRLAKDKYPPVVKANQRIGMICYGLFFVGIAPFIVTLEAVPLWRELWASFVLLMVYDFFYYLTHRFLFHGPILLKVHGLHHQARDPSHIDAFYVHPVETVIGTALFMGTFVAVAAWVGGLHAVTAALVFVLWIQLNTINHTRVDLPYFPFKTLTWITKKHHVHHENMQKGNYATITLLYDKLFGTLD
jgi:sterol desaturase/sphingolipid hydroxylase (fatty acid hydroxylase superfamily)